MRQRSICVSTLIMDVWAKIARIFILCPYSYQSSAWDCIAHAYKTGSWYSISTTNKLFHHILVLVVPAKFGVERLNRFNVIQLLVKFVILSAAILDFEKCHFWSSQCLRATKVKLHLKFCGNRTDGSEVIQVFVNNKIASPPSWNPLFSNFRPTILCSTSSSTLERKLIHLSWTVQKLWCFVNFSFSLYFNMGFYCACA